MVLYNADGSRAEMSGNGIRCLAQALGRAPRRPQPAAHRHRRRRRVASSCRPTDDPHASMASVEHGRGRRPSPRPTAGTTLGADPHRPVAHLSLGNPHTVVAVDDVAAVDLAALGAQRARTSTSRSSRPGPSRRRHHDAGARARRRHHRGVRHRRRAPPPAPPVGGAWPTPRDGEIIVHMDGGDAKVSSSTATTRRRIVTSSARPRSSPPSSWQRASAIGRNR